MKNIIKKIGDFLNYKDNKFEIAAIIIVSVIATTFFCFGYDLWHTSNCSLAYLQGHFLDFYDYNINERNTGTIVYFPTIYILFAIWNIPLRIAGITNMTYNSAGALLWSKGLGLLFLIVCYWAVYKLVNRLTDNKTIAKNSLIIMALGIPILYLFEFSWGLYDTVWLAMCLLGILNLMKNTRKNSIVAISLFAIAVTLKMFVLFIIIPILCYRFKNIGALIISILGTLVLWGVEIFIYRDSVYFVKEVISPLNGGFLSNALWGMSLNHVSFLLVIFIIGCMCAYTLENNDLIGHVYIPFVIGIIFSTVAQMTPNWNMIYMPFLVILISVMPNKNRRICYLCTAALSVGIITYTMTTRGYWFGETSLGVGVLGRLLFGVNNPADVCLTKSATFYTAKIYGVSSITDNMIMNYSVTISFAVAIFLCIYFAYQMMKNDLLLSTKNEMNYIIDKKERLEMYLLLTLVCGVLYYIPVTAWAFNNRPLTNENTVVSKTLSGENIHCSIDYCNRISVLEKLEYTILDKDDSIILEGWSGYMSTLEPTDSVEAICNDKKYKASVGIERSDVSENLDSDSLLNSGWSVEIPADEVKSDDDGIIEIVVYKGDVYNTFTFTIKSNL